MRGECGSAGGETRCPRSAVGQSSAPGPCEVGKVRSAWHLRCSPASQAEGLNPALDVGAGSGCGCRPGVSFGQAEREPGAALVGGGILASVQRRRDSPRVSDRERGRKGAAGAPPHIGILREVRASWAGARLQAPHRSPGAPAFGTWGGKKGSRRGRYCSFLSLRRSNAIVQSY